MNESQSNIGDAELYITEMLQNLKIPKREWQTLEPFFAEMGEEDLVDQDKVIDIE